MEIKKKTTCHTDLYKGKYFTVTKANSGAHLDTTCVYKGRSDGEIHTCQKWLIRAAKYNYQIPQ